MKKHRPKLYLSLLLFAMSFSFFSCHKSEHRVSKLIDRDWVFAETPPKNIHNQEDRTIFDGSETLRFSKDQAFFVNDKHYGTWEYDRKTETILITQAASEPYSCCSGSPGCVGGQSSMSWEIVDLSRDVWEVKHPYYVFTETRYHFKAK